jgi:hypothetical protein
VLKLLVGTRATVALHGKLVRRRLKGIWPDLTRLWALDDFAVDWS